MTGMKKNTVMQSEQDKMSARNSLSKRNVGPSVLTGKGLSTCRLKRLDQCCVYSAICKFLAAISPYFFHITV